MSLFIPAKKLKQFLLLVLLFGFVGGCGYEECKTDKQYADKPGICGKIYRTEQAKQLLNKKTIPKTYWILVIFFLPIIILLIFRIMRLLLSAIWSMIVSLLSRFRRYGKY